MLRRIRRGRPCASSEFTLATPAAQAWRAYFEDAILLAGAEGEASIEGSGDTATLRLGVGSMRGVIHLRLVTAGVEIQ